jgi:hypothetical protein
MIVASQKNPDLTQDKEKPTVEETSVTPIDQIVPGNNLASSDIVEQEKSSAGGKNKRQAPGLQRPV